jgi:glutamate racemase
MQSAMSTAPVVVFDSGVGGLSVLKALCRTLPGESFYYIADSLYVPYGDRPATTVVERSRQVAAYGRSLGAKALVIPCNTATAAASAELRLLYPDWIVIGIEPAVKPAAAITKTGVVGVLATTGTLNSDKFRRLVERVAQGVRVVVQPCPGVVEHIEAGDLDSVTLRELLRAYVAALLAQGADVLVLGCTHYPFVGALIAALAGPAVRILETGEAVGRETRRRLAAVDALRSAGGTAERLFMTTGDPETFRRQLGGLWGNVAELDVRRVELP